MRETRFPDLLPCLDFALEPAPRLLACGYSLRFFPQAPPDPFDPAWAAPALDE